MSIMKHNSIAKINLNFFKKPLASAERLVIITNKKMSTAKN